MTPDPTPPYRASDFCPHCREKFLAVVGLIAPALEATLSPAPPEPITTPEDTLRRAGITSEREAVYQRRLACPRARRRRYGLSGFPVRSRPTAIRRPAPLRLSRPVLAT